jgi:hypothetical protein
MEEKSKTVSWVHTQGLNLVPFLLLYPYQLNTITTSRYSKNVAGEVLES